MDEFLKAKIFFEAQILRHRMRRIFQLGIFFTLLILTNCAKVTPLTGGIKDTTPPKIDSTKTTPNFQTNYEKGNIEIYFDEWVEVKDIQSKLVIAPPLEKQPKVSRVKKAIRLEFDDDEILRENTTYVINFGDAIVDLTEGNPYPELRYVLSTGDYIDSLEVSGKVIDAVTKEPVKDVSVMLYDILADSVIRTEKPYYFAKTNESGNYKIRNIKLDTFKVVALLDADNNFLYNNPEEEKLGYLYEPIIVSDTVANIVNLQIFQNAKILKVLKRDFKNFGYGKLVFNDTPTDVQFSYEDIGQTLHYETEKDSIKVWYDVALDSVAWNIFLQKDTSLLDTTLVISTNRGTAFESKSLKPSKNNADRVKHNPLKPFSVAFNHPLKVVDTTKILLFQDSVLTKREAVIAIDSAQHRHLNISANWIDTSLYEILILPEALEDLYAIKNKDSISRSLTLIPEKETGSFKLSFLQLDPQRNYVFEFLGKGDEMVETFYSVGDSTFSKELKGLLPGDYSVRIIVDENKNGRWDSGNYDQKKQPEKIYIKKLEALRANWETDSEIKIED